MPFLHFNPLTKVHKSLVKYGLFDSVYASVIIVSIPVCIAAWGVMTVYIVLLCLLARPLVSGVKVWCVCMCVCMRAVIQYRVSLCVD